MKITKMLLALVSVAAIASVCNAVSMEEGFAKPPAAAKPRCWWHWMNRNISKEGITKDLEAMAAAGLGGATILDVSCFGHSVSGKVNTLSADWFDCVQHSISEAKRLGIDLSIANCPGWSSSGGPWIRPEYAMKNLGWTTVTVDGGKTLKLKLKRCELPRGFGKEVAVLAYPAVPGDGFDFFEAVEKITLLQDKELELPPLPQWVKYVSDVELLKKPDWTNQFMFNPTLSKKEQGFIVELKKPMKMSTLKVGVSGPPWSNIAKYRISVSDDGKAWREHCITEGVPKDAKSVSFPAVTAKYFKIEPRDCKWLPVMSIGLSPRVSIPEIGYKAVYQFKDYNHFVREGGTGSDPVPSWIKNTMEPPKECAIDLKKGIDLSGKMDAEGNLEWDAPPGKWTIYRFTMYTRHSGNHPANPEGTGLECDKMSNEGVDEVWRGMMGPIVTEAKKRGVSSALKYTLIDSFEVGPQNWTDRMVEEFKRLRGYDPVPYLPAMTGTYVVDSETTERFLEDLRRTVADLFAECYGLYYKEKANKEGIALEVEPYGGPFDELLQGGSCDVPMCEFWLGGPYDSGNARLAGNIADILGRKYVQSETHTTSGEASYRIAPCKLKAQGDGAFCAGVNRFVYHSYAHQSFETTGPGMCMGPWGFFFNRHNSMWPLFAGWLGYVGRAQFMLQQGRTVNDVLYLVQENAPNTPDWLPRTPFGYRANSIESRMFLKDLKANGNTLELPGGQRYRVLVLPRVKEYSPEILEKVIALANAGVGIVLGPRAERSFGLYKRGERDERVKSAAKTLWGGLGDGVKSKRIGKGTVWVDTPLDEVLKALKVAPDFETAEDIERSKLHKGVHDNKLGFYHRLADDRDIYFVVNHTKGPLEFTARFRAKGAVEFWDPMMGKIAAAPVWKAEEEITSVAMCLKEGESRFVVFRKNAKSAAHLESGSEKDLAVKKGKVVRYEARGELDISKDWKVKFQAHRGAPEGTHAMPELVSLSKSSDNGIKYFSGTALYSKKVTIGKDAALDRVVLDLGAVGSGALVRINGKTVGYAWAIPYEIDITGFLKPGANDVKIVTANSWRNRFIGDEQEELPPDSKWKNVNGVMLMDNQTLPEVLLEGKMPKGRFAYGVSRPYKKSDALEDSGLMGPVKVKFYTLK